MVRTRMVLLAAAVALVAGTSTAAGQSASINATATVLQPLTVTAVQDLAFGNVFPGLNKTIAYTDGANGGRWSVAGEASRQVSMSFTLPANLTSGANTLPIGTWTGYHNTTNSPAAGGTAFTPSAAATLATLSATGQLFLFVGGTVSPSVTQAAGAYTAPVTVTVVYTGL